MVRHSPLIVPFVLSYWMMDSSYLLLLLSLCLGVCVCVILYVSLFQFDYGSILSIEAMYLSTYHVLQMTDRRYVIPNNRTVRLLTVNGDAKSIVQVVILIDDC